MPLPVLHSFAGYSIYTWSGKKNSRRRWAWAVFAVILANLADLDFLVGGIFFQNAGRFHRGISHSLGAALLCGLLVGVAAAGLRSNDTVRRLAAFFENFCFATGAYLSHVVLDFLSAGNTRLPVLWPFSPKRFSSPFSFFNWDLHGEAVKGSGSLTQFTADLMNPIFFKRLLLEVVFVFFMWSAWKVIGVNRESSLELRKRVRVKEATVLVGFAAVLFFWTYALVK